MIYQLVGWYLVPAFCRHGLNSCCWSIAGDCTADSALWSKKQCVAIHMIVHLWIGYVLNIKYFSVLGRMTIQNNWNFWLWPMCLWRIRWWTNPQKMTGRGSWLTHWYLWHTGTFVPVCVNMSTGQQRIVSKHTNTHFARSVVSASPFETNFLKRKDIRKCNSVMLHGSIKTPKKRWKILTWNTVSPCWGAATQNQPRPWKFDCGLGHLRDDTTDKRKWASLELQ